MKDEAVDISVIIVSYNTRDMTLACLRSVCERTVVTHEIIVVDNASSDGTVDAIRAEHPDVTLIRNEDNRGFAAANNQGFRVAGGRYLLLLNPDTEVHERCLDDTLAFAKSRTGAGAIGCRAFSLDGEQQSTLVRFPTLRRLVVKVLVPNRIVYRSKLLGWQARYIGIDLDQPQDVEVVCGCFMLVPREVYETVGGLDEAFFMYGEEVEWCYRIRQGGWRVLYFPGASILHYGAASTEEFADEMSLALAKSQLLAFRKIRGRTMAFFANVLMLLRDLPRAVLWVVVARLSVPRDESLRDLLRRSSERCWLHARGLFKLDWYRG